MSDSKIIALADASHLAARPLPSAPDGRYDWQELCNAAGSVQQQSGLHKLVTAIKTHFKRGPIIKNPSIINAVIDSLKNKNAIDDREGLFTTGLSILCQLPQDSAISKKLNDAVITRLYNSMPHPPATYIGTDLSFASAPSQVTGPSVPGVKSAGSTDSGDARVPPTPSSRMPFSVRSADGGGNNVNMPNLGKSGMPYARSVQNQHPLPSNMLPESGLVFDSLLKAREWKPHPGGNSALTFAFASLVTHTLFRTDPRDQTRNNATSYLDLSILYGINQFQQDLVRNRKAGRGFIWPDSFAEDRLVLLPPAVSALLVVFSRNHNYVAKMLLNINERGRWTDPPPENDAKRAVQDEEIFQVARLVNCGHFMAMIFGDYVAGFLGLGRDGNSWSMNPFDPIKGTDGKEIGRGEGNHCSVEFNLLYRWHAVTAQKDIKWTEDLYHDAFDGKPFSELSLKDFVPGVTKVWQNVDPNPRTRTFAGLKRGDDGSFDDDELAKILQDATESMAGAYRARGTPEVLRIIEILSMEQARTWGVCTMNEFRKFLGLKPFDTFEEWNRDKAVATAAKQLYGHIDCLELYPGLQAEDCMPLGPGSGICCGYTMTRAILGDAVALVRGDRFYTTDYTPANLTAWGFQDCARDPNNGAFGAALPRLLFRHFPRHYPANSAYALFSFFTPEVTRQNLTKLGLADQYTFDRPKTLPRPKVISTIQGIQDVLSNSTKFTALAGNGVQLLAEAFKALEDEKTKAALRFALFPSEESITSCAAWHLRKTVELIKQHSYVIEGVPGTRVDIVQNVINTLAVHWVSEFLSGFPLKTTANPLGLYTEQETFDMLKLLFTGIFTSVPPEQGWTMQRQAQHAANVLGNIIKERLEEAAPSTAPNPVTKRFSAMAKCFKKDETKPGHDFLRRLAESGSTITNLVPQILGLAVGSSVGCALVAAQIVEFYLDDTRTKEYQHIVELASSDSPTSIDLLRGYVREVMRLNAPLHGLPRVATSSHGIFLGRERGLAFVQAGDVVLPNTRDAHLDPIDFPEPVLINARRSGSNHAIGGPEFHPYPDLNRAEQIISQVVKAVFQLKNLRRAPGNAGRLMNFANDQYGTSSRTYITNGGGVSCWPGSLTVVYDSL